MLKKRLSGKKLFEFYATLSLFDKNSVPMIQAIQYLAESDSTNTLYATMLNKASTTSKLSNILEGLIPDKHLDYFRVSEGNGAISTMLVKLEELQNLEMSLIKKLKQSLTMPIILFFACLVIIIGYGRKVLPNFEGILPMAEWPFISSSLVYFANFALSFKAIVLIAFLVGLGFALVSYTQNNNSEFREKYVDRFPGFKLYKNFMAFTFLNKFSFLVDLGIGYHDALKIINKDNKGRLKYYIDKMISNGGDNSNVDEVINVGLIDHQDVVLLGMFSKNRSFDSAIIVAVDRANSKIQQEIEIAGTSIKMIMLMVVAAVILWTYMSVNVLVMNLV